MTTRNDILVLVQADLDDAKAAVHEAHRALQGRGLYAHKPTPHTREAVRLMTKATRRLQRSFLKEGS